VLGGRECDIVDSSRPYVGIGPYQPAVSPDTLTDLNGSSDSPIDGPQIYPERWRFLITAHITAPHHSNNASINSISLRDRNRQVDP